MDKETLSNYGWIVICVLVMVVMIALAGPFGNFVADAVKSTAQGLFDTNKNALDAAGITIDGQEFVKNVCDSKIYCYLCIVSSRQASLQCSNRWGFLFYITYGRF